MRIVFFGTPQFAVPSLQRLLAAPDLQVAAVVTQPDKRRGRGQQLTPSPVKAIAISAQIPVWQPARLKKDPPTLTALADLQADAFVVVAYGQILSPQILALPRLGCINAHASLLPKYRGAAPIQWCLYHGESVTGVTTMLMDAGMDTGPMLLRRSRPIGLLDTALEVAKDLAAISADLLPATLHQLQAGRLTPEPQPEAKATYAPLIRKQDYVLDWTRPAIALHNQVRGFYPHSVTWFRGQALKIEATVPLDPAGWEQVPSPGSTLRSQIAPDLPESAPGTLVAIARGHGPIVQTGEGLLLLRTVKPSGKQSQSGWDFVNGSRLAVGEGLGRDG